MSCCNNNQNCYHDPCGSAFNQSVTQAAQYAQYAQTQANKAEDLWKEFNALYLGAFAVAPTQDNEGNPLQTGALYWNTVANELYAWNGLAWVTATGFNELTPFLATGSVTPMNLVTRFEDIDQVKDFPTYQFTAIGTTTPRNLVTRMADVINVKDFGAVGDGVTNDRAAIQLAIVSLGAAGGTVYIPNGMKCLINSNGLIVKPNVSLVGPHKFVGSPQDNSSAPYNNLGGAIILDAATAGVSIYMKGGSSISGLLIYRKGMVFPVQNASAFTGTAIIAEDDDVSVSHSMILGFNKAYFSQGHQRARIEYVYMDNVNGIEIVTCYDIAYISNCHAWPFASIAWGVGSTIIRSGTAYKFSNVNDWCKLTNCFSYGYFRGCQLSAVNSMTLLGCGFDNVPGGHPNSMGITIEGGCLDTRIIGCQCAAQATAGIFMDNGAGWTTIESYNCWGGSTHGVLIYNGNAIIKGSGIRDVSFAVSTTSSTSELIFNNNYCYNISSRIINSSSNNTRTLYGQNNVALTTYINPLNNIVCDTVTPAASICSLPQYGNVFFVNGTNSFNELRYGWAGRQVTLIFTAVLTVTGTSSPTPSSNEMILTGNFTTAIGNTLTLIHTGTVWYEVSRRP